MSNTFTAWKDVTLKLKLVFFKSDQESQLHQHF